MFLTLSEEPPGTYEVCPVCFWEDDPVQFSDVDYSGGANLVSLRQARLNFKNFGAKEQSKLPYVRLPFPEEEL